MLKLVRFISFFLIMLLSLEVLSSLNACQDQCIVLETETRQNCQDCLHVVRSVVLINELQLNLSFQLLGIHSYFQTTMELGHFSAENFRPPNGLVYS